MRADPTLHLLSDDDLLEAIRFWDATFDNRAQMLTVEETGAVRHILSILNGELAERRSRQALAATSLPAVASSNGVVGHGRQPRPNWVRRIFH